MKKILYIILFLLIGEIILQIDFKLNNIEVKDEVSAGPIAFDETKPKVYLLGDSYTKGLGIPTDSKLVNLLNHESFSIIDSSHSGDNWADYLSILKVIRSTIKPGSFIVIGVNWNDVAFYPGSISSIINQVDTLNKEDTVIVNSQVRENVKPQAQSLMSYVRLLYTKSKLFSFLSANTQNLLKRKGLALPLGDFHYFRKVAYYEKQQELEQLMDFIVKMNVEKNVQTILYLMPDFNLTNQTKYFDSFTNFFLHYNGKKRIHIINGIKDFQNSKDGYYCLSIHDGHPNGKAHLNIASSINKLIYNIQARKSKTKK